ncbi:hypothetical protein MICRO116_200043 [Micrococcus sp. 116]|nr:hypothetical protein MICRO116_200043 [Micrococcus sp. 116]
MPRRPGRLPGAAVPVPGRRPDARGHRAGARPRGGVSGLPAPEGARGAHPLGGASVLSGEGARAAAGHHHDPHHPDLDDDRHLGLTPRHADPWAPDRAPRR